MTNDELLDKIFSVEATAVEALNNVQAVIPQVDGLNGRLNSQQNEIERINSIVSAAITTAVHELIEYLRYNDIQTINEEEFSVKVHELIFNADPMAYVPF